MTLMNDISAKGSVTRGELKTYLTLLNPFAPHITEEMWEMAGFEGMMVTTPWPTYDEAKCKDSEVTIAVQVNGKMRGTVMMDADLDNDTVVQNVLANEKIAAFLAKQEGQIRKTIVVKNKLVNLIVK